MIGVVNNRESQTFCIITLTYGLICLFSFFNLTYVRDLDALQINFTPVLLTIMALLNHNSSDYILMCLTFVLMSDAYFGIRYREHSDEIEYTPLELYTQ